MKKLLTNQIENLEEEIAKLKKLSIYYEDVLVKLNNCIEFLTMYSNVLKESNPELSQVVEIINQIKNLTKTEDFDYIEDMNEYLKNNVDNKNWVKFNSLYNTCFKLLLKDNLVEKYTTYANFTDTITNYEKSTYDSLDQISVINNLINEKQKQLSNLKEKYNSLNQNKKEENILNI